MSSFTLIAGSLLGCKSIGIKRRILLSFSLVISKLLFHIHIWSVFDGKARRIIYNVYMRVWRRVVGDCRFRKTEFTDKQVRDILQVPSLDCLVRRRRLMYLGRVARADLDPLHALLQARCKYDKHLD